MNYSSHIAEAKRAYAIAVEVYWEQRNASVPGIVSLAELERQGNLTKQDAEDMAAGMRFKAVTPAGRAAMGHFQLAKADLDHWFNLQRRENGDTRCPVCPPDREGP